MSNSNLPLTGGRNTPTQITTCVNITFALLEMNRIRTSARTEKQHSKVDTQTYFEMPPYDRWLLSELVNEYFFVFVHGNLFFVCLVQ